MARMLLCSKSVALAACRRLTGAVIFRIISWLNSDQLTDDEKVGII